MESSKPVAVRFRTTFVMTLDYSEKGKPQVSMILYLINLLKESPYDIW